MRGRPRAPTRRGAGLQNVVFCMAGFSVGRRCRPPIPSYKRRILYNGFQDAPLRRRGVFCSLLSRRPPSLPWRLRCFRVLGASRPFVSRGLLLSFLLGVPRCARHPSFAALRATAPVLHTGGGYDFTTFDAEMQESRKKCLLFTAFSAIFVNFSAGFPANRPQIR